MSLPVHDWQFWVVTVAALGAAAVIVRNLWPRKRRRRARRATLTVEGKPLERLP